MKLNVDFKELFNSVSKMGAEDRDFTLKTVLPELEGIDIDLTDGISVNIKDVEVLPNGLLSYKGRQVLLYIQEHWNVEEALNDGSLGNKYHVANCKTLEEMKTNGRYDRYVAQNGTHGRFFIDGRNQNISGKTNLKVCKNCLSHLNYNDYKDCCKDSIFNTFLLEEFFKKYQVFFKHEPKYPVGSPSSYPKNWDKKSKAYKESVAWCCEECKVDLIHNKSLLDTHHINGVKHDCEHSNLKALCKECHSHAPKHNHMKVKDEDKSLLKKLRLQQERELICTQL